MESEVSPLPAWEEPMPPPTVDPRWQSPVAADSDGADVLVVEPISADTTPSNDPEETDDGRA
jgi:hypothetical protein